MKKATTIELDDIARLLHASELLANDRAAYSARCCRARRMRPERAELSKVVEGKGPGGWDLPIIQPGRADGEAHIGGAVTTP